MKQVISTSFGISEIHIGSVTVYTGKIAFKSLFGIEINPLIRQRKTAKGRIELSFLCCCGNNHFGEVIVNLEIYQGSLLTLRLT